MSFCEKCRYNAEDGQKFCRNCGYPLPEVPEWGKEKKKLLAVPGDAMLLLSEMNGNMHMIREKESQSWLIFRDGRVCASAYYAVTGETEIQSSQFSKVELFRLRRLCKALVKSRPKSLRCYDGVQHEIIVYRPDGSEEYHFYGYIFGNQIFGKMQKLVKKLPGIGFSEYV